MVLCKRTLLTRQLLPGCHRPLRLQELLLVLNPILCLQKEAFHVKLLPPSVFSSSLYATAHRPSGIIKNYIRQNCLKFNKKHEWLFWKESFHEEMRKSLQKLVTRKSFITSPPFLWHETLFLSDPSTRGTIFGSRCLKLTSLPFVNLMWLKLIKLPTQYQLIMPIRQSKAICGNASDSIWWIFLEPCK